MANAVARVAILAGVIFACFKGERELLKSIILFSCGYLFGKVAK